MENGDITNFKIIEVPKYKLGFTILISISNDCFVLFSRRTFTLAWDVISSSLIVSSCENARIILAPEGRVNFAVSPITYRPLCVQQYRIAK